MNWFRFYHTALDDPKVQLLEPALFKAWVNILCLTSMSEPRGELPDVVEVAFRLRMTVPATIEVCNTLVDHGLIDDVEARLFIHNWATRQPNSDDVNSRVRKHRSGPTGSTTVSAKNNETLQVTETKRYGNGLDTERERELERETAAASKPRTDAREKPPPSLYIKTLNGALPKLEKLFQQIDQDLFTPSWLHGVLVEAERTVGPLSRDQLGRGLNVAMKEMGRRMTSEKPPTSPRPYARKLIVDYLTEQREGNHASSH